MTKYREILRLLSLHLTMDDIMTGCGVAKKIIIKVRDRAKELGISWPLGDDMTDEKLESIMFPKKPKSASKNECRTSTISRRSCSGTELTRSSSGQSTWRTVAAIGTIAYVFAILLLHPAG